MAKVIEVPGQGPVEFPDSMTDDQIVSAIQKMPKGTDKVAVPAATPAAPAPAPVNPQANVQRFLDFLSKAEGADYNVITGGGKFSDFSRHPNVVGLVTKEGPSTAAGRYQITKSTYDDIAPKIGVFDFSPASQDKLAIEIIKRRGALEDVQKGDYQAAIGKLGNIWASLPTSPYNQPKKSWDWVNKELNKDYVPFAPVRQNIDPKTLNTDQDWLKASMLMYQFWERKPFEGTNDELAEWGKDSLGNFNYNMVSMAEIAHALTNASDEEKRAFLYMMDTYDNTNVSWEGVKRFGKGVATDPTNLVGVGSLGLGTLAKLGIQATTKTAAKLAIKDLVIKSLARTGIAAGMEGAIFSAADSTIRQGVEVTAGRRQEIDLSKVGVDAAFGAAAGVALGTTADLALSKIFSTIHGVRGGEAPKVSVEAPKAGQEASSVVAGVTPKAEGKVVSELDLGNTKLTPAEQAAAIERQQPGRLPADEAVPNVPPGTKQIDVPELNTGMRTTRLTDEAAAKISKAEVRTMADTVVEQLRDVKTEDLPAVLEGIRTRTDLSDEQRLIRDRALQDFKNELVVDLAEARKERAALDAKAGQLNETQAARYDELKAKIEELEARSAPAVLADDAAGSLAGLILQQRQDPFNALKGVTVESIMKEQNISKAEAEQVWSEMVGRAQAQSEMEKIKAQYDEKAIQALAEGNEADAIKAVIQKNREIDSQIEAMAPKSASLIQKINEFAISNIFSVKTILINLIPSGIKTLVIPALKAVFNNPFEKATRAEFVASYSAMRSSFSGAMQAAAAGFRYEQALLTRDGTRLVEGELAMKGQVAGAWRIFPRILNASDEFLSRINYDSFVAGRAAANAAMEGAEKGLKGKALNDYIAQESKKAVDAALKPVKGDELVQPIINKGLNLGLTGDKLFAWVEKEAMKNPSALRKGNDEEALNFVREVLYKKAFSGEGSFSKAAQWYEDGMKRFPTIRFLIGQMFFRTPIRVFEEGIRLTPGVQFLAPNMMADLAGKNGTLKQVKAQAEAMSSLVIASAVLSLYSQGRISGDGAYSDYKQEKLRSDSSLPEKYSILMSDGSTWSYKNFDPLATPIKIIINALERRDKLRIKEAQGLYDGKEADQKLLAAVTVASSSIWTALRDASLVEGANNFIKFVEAAFNPEEGEDKFIKALGDKLFMMVPNTLHKIARENDPTIKDPQTFWQMVEEKLLKPIGLDDKSTQAAYAYDVIGNVRKMSDTGVLWNVFSTSTIEERSKGMSEKEQFVLAEMDRLSRTTGVVWKPPVKSKDLGDFDMRTVMAADGKRTLYDVWQENYRSLDPAEKLYPILAAPLPEGTFKYKGIKQEEALSMINTLQDAALALTMKQEGKVIQRYQEELLRGVQSKTGFFDTPRPY